MDADPLRATGTAASGPSADGPRTVETSGCRLPSHQRRTLPKANKTNGCWRPITTCHSVTNQKGHGA